MLGLLCHGTRRRVVCNSLMCDIFLIIMRVVLVVGIGEIMFVA
jgi:hypothetical protein